MRIGILGGTFDPPHLGHLLIADQARERLGLEQVYFVPAPEPPHKQGEPVSPFSDRVAMLRRALAGYPFFAISLVEANRAGPSYTTDTLRRLHLDFRSGTKFFFIMGSDSLEDLPTWHEPRELVKLARLAVLRRPGHPVDLEALEKQVPGIRSSVVVVPAPELTISSTEIQARVCAGRPIDDLVPPGVAEYIREHRLYKRTE